MKREVKLTDIDPGHLYTKDSMVRLGCDDCAGCSACCQGMGESIILDPLDVFLLSKNLRMSFQELLSDAVSLSVADGVILPHLSMDHAGEQCTFLTDAGRCSIHDFRPGICRLFPLGRLYENGSFKYFLQSDECKKSNRTKIKIKKWLDIPDLDKYEAFVVTWHYFLNDVADVVSRAEDENQARQINMALLKLFYIQPYDEREFYIQFRERLERLEAYL